MKINLKYSILNNSFKTKNQKYKKNKKNNKKNKKSKLIFKNKNKLKKVLT